MTRQAARAAGNDTAARRTGNYSTLALSFARHLRASNLSPASIKTYLDAVERLRLYLDRPASHSTLK